MRSALFVLASLLWIAGGCAAPSIGSLEAGPSPGSVLQPASALVPAEPESDRPQLEASKSSPAAWMERLFFPKRLAWQQWGEANLQTGDLVFTRGNYYLLLGAINFSDFLCTVSASPFSHVGIVAIEDGQAMVYDISDSGLRSAPFARYVTHSNFEQVAVRRPRPELYSALPQVVRFVRRKQAEGVSFDRRFDLENDSLYCSEMIVEAFAASGVEIAAPVPAGELPGLSEVSPWSLTLARLATGLELSDAVYTIGNEASGLYGSPWFVECLPPTEL